MNTILKYGSAVWSTYQLGHICASEHSRSAGVKMGFNYAVLPLNFVRLWVLLIRGERADVRCSVQHCLASPITPVTTDSGQ